MSKQETIIMRPVKSTKNKVVFASTAQEPVPIASIYVEKWWAEGVREILLEVTGKGEGE